MNTASTSFQKQFPTTRATGLDWRLERHNSKYFNELEGVQVVIRSGLNYEYLGYKTEPNDATWGGVGRGIFSKPKAAADRFTIRNFGAGYFLESVATSHNLFRTIVNRETRLCNTAPNEARGNGINDMLFDPVANNVVWSADGEFETIQTTLVGSVNLPGMQQIRIDDPVGSRGGFMVITSASSIEGQLTVGEAIVDNPFFTFDQIQQLTPGPASTFFLETVSPIPLNLVATQSVAIVNPGGPGGPSTPTQSTVAAAVTAVTGAATVVATDVKAVVGDVVKVAETVVGYKPSSEPPQVIEEHRILGMTPPVFYTIGGIALVAVAIAIGVVISRRSKTTT